jgi:hypothetical protein
VIDPQQRRLAAAALAVAGEHGFALAGGLALAAHGVGARPSDDIDLFTANTDPAAFTAAVDAVQDTFARNGWAVEDHRRGPLYARLIVEVDPGQRYELDLAVDYRAHPPVAVADLGPVLDVADAVGSKMTALYGRGEVRDYVDVRETVVSGRYTREQVLGLADDREVHPLDRAVLAQRLAQAARIPDRELVAYLTAEDAAELRAWFTTWAADIREVAPPAASVVIDPRGPQQVAPIEPLLPPPTPTDYGPSL